MSEYFSRPISEPGENLFGGLHTCLLTLAQALEERLPGVDASGNADDGGDGESQPAGTATTATHKHRFEDASSC